MNNDDMRSALTERIEEDFPFLKKTPTLDTAFNHRGIECSAGWSEILTDLISAIREKYKVAGVDIEDITILQIKEKFGTLRVYVAFERNEESLKSLHSEVRNLIHAAEEESRNVCELCGSHHAKLRTEMPWMKTLCEKCFSDTTPKEK